MMLFLTVIKWIGITLAGLSGLALLLILLILFIPVRYCGKLVYEDEFSYSFLAGWLFPLLFIRKSQKRERVCLYVLGFPVKNFTEGETKEVKENVAGKKTGGEEGTGSEPEPVLTENEEKTERRKNQKKKKKKKKSKKSFSFRSVSRIINTIRDKETRCLVKRIKQELFLLLHHILPRKIRGEFLIGMGEPDLTGLLFGCISLMPFAYKKGVCIRPDFENRVFRAHGKICGRIRLFFLLRMAVRLYRDRELRGMIEKIKNKEAA